MSIRIDGNADRLVNSAASQSSQSEQVRNGHGTYSSLAGTSSGGDSVQFSSMAGIVAAAGSAENTQNSEKIRHLAALYAAGKYEVESSQVSHAIVSNAMSGTGLK